MRNFLFLLPLLLTLGPCAQDSSSTVTTERFAYQLGDRTIYISRTVHVQDETKPEHYLLVQLHGNEATAYEAAMQTLEVLGGTLLRIEHNRRNINFSLNGKRYSFDPNRMFSRKGIQASLQTYGNYSVAAINAIEGFARFFLSHIPDKATVIALHNNSDQNFSAASYRNNREYRSSALEVHMNEVLDPDNFFLLTDQRLFEGLSQMDYNVVLQNNESAPDDGSLSIYCGRRGIRYVNIESQMGALSTQQSMLEELLRLLELD